MDNKHENRLKRAHANRRHDRKTVIGADDVLNLKIDLATLTVEEFHSKYFRIGTGARKQDR
jgi:hypothetical protein